MPIYIYKENSQISTNAVRNHKVVKAIYAKEQGQGAVCVWGIDRSIPYDQMFTYSVSSDNKVTITGLRPEVKTAYITIPDTLDSKPVSSIGISAFESKNNIVSITIPDSVTTIGEHAFYKCTSLTSITLPSNVTSIGKGAFYGCDSLTSITIPDRVTSIGDAAFADCDGLTSITIPDSVTSIGVRAFASCSYLKSVNISNSVTTIGESTFSRCSRLVSIVIPDSVTTIGQEAFAYCTGLTSVTIGKNVTNIDFHAFTECYKLIEVYNKSNLAINKGDSLHNGQVALYAKNVYRQANGSNLTNDNGYVIYTEGYKKILVAYTGTSTKLILPSYVTEIYQYAFYGFYSLTNVTIPTSVTNIGNSAFNGCDSLTSITIPNNVMSIGNYAFSGCYRLVEVYNKSTLSITAGSSDNGYVACYAKNVYTNEGGSKLTTDENGCVIYTDVDEKILVAYHGTNTELILPSDITKIYQYAFSRCSSLTSIMIPDSVTNIGNSAFAYCSSLTSITIPDSVTSIGEAVFSGCSSLTSITFKGAMTQWNAISKGPNWDYDTGNYTIHCTDGNIPKS